MHAPESLDGVLDVGGGMGGREREREHLVARSLGDRKARLVGVALAVVGEPVDREEVDARPDLLLPERVLVRVPVGAGALGVDADDVEMERVVVACVAGERLDPGEVGDGGVVRRDVPAADLRMLVDLLELAERDRREDVGEVRLEAGDGRRRRGIPRPGA